MAGVVTSGGTHGAVNAGRGGARGGARVPSAPARGPARGGRGNANANPLLNPSSVLSGGSLQQAAQALTDAQTAGPITELAKSIAQGDANTRNQINQAGGYFNQFGKFAQQGVTDQNAVSQSLKDSLAGIANTENQRLADSGNQAVGALNAYTPGGAASGTNAAGLADLQQQIAKAGGLAAQQEGNLGGYGTTLGAIGSTRASGELGVGALAGTQALRNLTQAGVLKDEPLNAKMAGLQAQRGALLSANEGKLRQQEIANQTTKQHLAQVDKQLGITTAYDAGKLQQGAANTRAANARNAATIAGANSRNNANIASRQQIAAANRQAKAQGKPPVYTATGQRVLPAGQMSARLNEVGSLAGSKASPGIINQMRQPLDPTTAKSLGLAPGAKLSDSQIKGYLLDGNNPLGVKFTPAQVDAGWALLGYGYLTPKQVTELNKDGIIVGNRFKRGQVPARAPQGNPLFGPGGASALIP